MVNAVLRDDSFFFFFFSFEHLLFCTYLEIRAAHFPAPSPAPDDHPNQRETTPTKEGDKMQEIAFECGKPRSDVIERKGSKADVLDALAEFVVRTAKGEDPRPEAVAVLPAAAELVLDYA